jgi:adenosylmethionine-8-amino-7-oxononanoate aminotransferase
MLFHSHSFTANPLACAVANASMDLMEQTETWENIERISASHAEWGLKIKHHPILKNIRHRGTIIALELETGENNSYLHSIRDIVYEHFISKGILLRPLGNTLYILAPYCISNQQLAFIYQEMEDFANNLIKHELS